MSSPEGVLITNDGATILNRMTVAQPAAKMLVELSKSQVGNVILIAIFFGCATNQKPY